MFCSGVTNASHFFLSLIRMKMSATYLVQVKCYDCFMCGLTCSSVTVYDLDMGLCAFRCGGDDELG